MSDQSLRPTPRQHAAALFSLLGIFWLAFLGDPVFKRADLDLLDEGKAYRKVEKQYGPVVANASWAGAWIRQHVRKPIEGALRWTTEPLRLQQGYGVYPDGGRSMKVLDIRLDGELVHRSGSDELVWIEPQLRFRKLRPLVFKFMADRKKRRFQPGIVRYIGAMAEREGAERVDLVVHTGPYPGEELEPNEWASLSPPNWRVKVHEVADLPEDWGYSR